LPDRLFFNNDFFKLFFLFLFFLFFLFDLLYLDWPGSGFAVGLYLLS